MLEHQRGDAVSFVVYEANGQVKDLVYGCLRAKSSQAVENAKSLATTCTS